MGLIKVEINGNKFFLWYSKDRRVMDLLALDNNVTLVGTIAMDLTENQFQNIVADPTSTMAMFVL